MAMSEELLRYSQMARMLSLCGYYHLFKLAGNVIDGDEGVLEQRVSQLLAREILAKLDFQVEATGTENARHLERYCVVSTHASHLDWAVLLGYFPSPLRFIAKKELTAIPVIGSYLSLRGVLIDRKKGQDSRSAIKAATQDGKPWPILIFPEGTRTRDGKLQPFKQGGLRILAEAGLAMVPVSILGTFDAFSRHARAIRTGGRLSMAIGEPVVPDPNRGADWMLAEIERRVQALHQRGQGPAVK